MVEDLHTGVTSDVNGFYTLPNMKPGTYKVKVSYVGYSPKTYVIKLVGKNVERNIILSEGNELKGSGGERSLLRSAQGPADAEGEHGCDQCGERRPVGKFPDSNIGDALKRINGINVQYDQGEAGFGQVRGTSADLTSVTVNGNRMPSAEGDTRNVQLDLIPADMIQTIEVNKVVTSDMDGDAIGGEINLVTKTPPATRCSTSTSVQATHGSAANHNGTWQQHGATDSSRTDWASWPLPLISMLPEVPTIPSSNTRRTTTRR